MTGQWLVPLAQPAEPALEILCLPWAGGDAAGFYPLKAHVGPDVALWAVAPPGRQQRLMEPRVTDLERWIEAIGREIGRLPGRPLALLGHSFGALLAFELAHWLVDRGHPVVDLVCVSARRGPGMPSRTSHLAGATDDELVSWMRRLGGIRDELLFSREMLDLVLPPLRDDIALDVAYRPPERTPLDIPILVLTGDDDPTLPIGDLSDWERRTSAGCELCVLPGGHFYLQDRPGHVLGLIRKSLSLGAGPTSCANGRATAMEPLSKARTTSL
jgi:surfactin synthase thioesterase subunit